MEVLCSVALVLRVLSIKIFAKKLDFDIFVWFIAESYSNYSFVICQTFSPSPHVNICIPNRNFLFNFENAGRKDRFHWLCYSKYVGNRVSLEDCDDNDNHYTSSDGNLTDGIQVQS